jgi:hypothetical protein
LDGSGGAPVDDRGLVVLVVTVIHRPVQRAHSIVDGHDFVWFVRRILYYTIRDYLVNAAIPEGRLRVFPY